MSDRCTHRPVSYRPHVDVRKLSRNTKVVAEALARVIYNLTEKVQVHSELPHPALRPPLLFTCDMTCSLFSLNPRAPPVTLRSSLNKWWVTKHLHLEQRCGSEESTIDIFSVIRNRGSWPFSRC